MERQSTSKLFRILIAIAAFFILCSSSLLFAACDSTIGVKDHEHVLGETAIAETEASCTVPGTVTYKCTDEECSYVKTVVTGLPTGHDFDENGVCRVCKLTKSEAGDLDDTLQSTQKIQETLNGITKTLEEVAKSTDLQTKLATDTFNSTLQSKLTDLQTKLIADLLSDEDFGTAMSALQTTLQGNITAAVADVVAQVYQSLLEKYNDLDGDLASALSSLKTLLVGQGLADGETDLASALKKAITSGNSEIMTKLGEIETSLKAAIEANGDKIDDVETNLKAELTTKFNDLNTSLPTTLKEKVVDVLEAYLSSDEFLGKIMGETGFDGLQKQIEGYLGEESEVVTQLGSISTYLKETIKAELDNIKNTLGDAGSGLVKSVADLATQLTQATGDITGAIGKLQIPTADDIAKAVNTKLVGSLKTYFASSEYTKIIQDLLDNTFTTEKLNTLLGVTGESLVKELNAKFEGVTGAISDLNTLLTEGTTGKQIAALETMIKKVYEELFGSAYVEAGPAGAPSAEGPSIGEAEKPVGMLSQVDDLWDKTKGLLDNLAALQGENNEATLSAILTAVQGIKIPEGKDYTENFTNLTNTLNTLNTNYGTINTSLEKLQGDYNTLATNYTTLTNTVAGLQTELGKVNTTLGELKSQLNWVLSRSEKFEKLMQVLEGLWTEYGSYVTNEKLQEGLKTVLDFAVKNVGKLDRLNDIADTLAWFVNNKTKFESYVSSLDKYIEDIEKIYDAFHTALPDESLDSVLGQLQSFLKKALDNNYFEEAINAAKGLKNFLGTTDESGKPTTTLADIVGYFNNITDALDAIKKHGYDAGGVDHVHSWVEVLATNKDGNWVEAEAGVKPECLAENTYIYKCTICGATQKNAEEKNITKVVPATGHVVNYAKGLNVDGHYHAPTCVNPGYVQGFCVNCNDYIEGDWSAVGQPTYVHNYVLDEGATAPDKDTVTGATSHKCTNIGAKVYHCVTCGSAYVEEVKASENVGPDGKPTTHNYYSSLDVNGNLTGKPITDAEKLAAYKAYAEAEKMTDYEEWDVADFEKNLTPAQQYNALEKHLNIVKRGIKTCVDPALFVVECVECKMRYAYSSGEASGHTLTLMVDATHTRNCTTDGLRIYYYCDKCQHYFEFEGGTTIELDKDRKPNVDLYRYSVEYLKDAQGVITGKPTNTFKAGTTPELTDARTLEGQRAYDLQAEKAYGHTFEARVYTIDGDCLNPWRIFDVCSVCGFTEESKLDGHTWDKANIIADPNNTAVVSDVATGNFTPTWGADGKTYPDYIKNLQAVWEGGTLTRTVDKETKTYTGKQGVKDLLTELGYFTYCDVDLNGIKGVIGSENTLLSEKIITGWNISYIFANYDAAGHDFVPVKTNTLEGAGLCLDAQEYVLVCKNCFKAGGKKFAQLFEDTDKDGLYEAKSDNSTCTTAQQIKAAATLNNANSLISRQWKMFWTEDGKKLATNQKHWRGGTFVTDDVTVDDVANWLHQHGYLTRAAGDDETELDLLIKLRKLDAADDATVKTLKSYYCDPIDPLGELASNVIDGFALPVHGHTFNDFVYTVIDNCTMYARKVYFCAVCGAADATLNPELKGAASQKDTHYKVTPQNDDTLMGGSDKNDLARAWNAIYNDEQSDAADVLVWLANHGYFNAERELLEQTLYVEKVFQTITKDSDEFTALESFLKTELGKTSLEKTDLHDYFTFHNTTKEFKITQKLVDGELQAIKLGHTFAAVQVKTADCEAGGQYVYVCTTCGLEAGAALSNLNYNYTFEDRNVEIKTGIKLVPESFKEKEDSALLAESKHEDNTTITVTDLEAEWALKKTADDKFDWLYDHDYLQTIIDTLKGIGLKTYEDQAAFDEATGKTISEEEIKAAIAKHFLAKDDATWEEFTGSETVSQLDTLFTAKNETLAAVGTAVPAMAHLYADENGALINGDSATCTDFASKQFAEWLNVNDDAGKHYFAKWNAAEKKWERGEELSAEDWTKLKANTEFYEAAKTYGIIGACTRQDCPQHKQNYKAAEGTSYPYTAGYKAATDHEMHYYKFVEEAGGKLGTVPTKKVDMSVAYNRYSEDEYPMTVNDETYATRDDDPTNLDTLQRIYNAIHPSDENKDNRYPEDGSLWTEYGKDGAKEVKWQPITRGSKPSCWVDLRCKWYHYGDTENPYKGTAEPNPYDGTKCNERGEVNQHTLPLKTDPDYLLYEANCQHSRYCRICGAIIGETGSHRFISVDEIMAVDEDGNPLHKEYYDAYHEAYEALCMKLKELNPGKPLEDPALWAFQLEATCQQEGRKVEICAGELELYKNTIKPERWDELFNKNLWEQNTNYKITTVEPIEHVYDRHEWHVTYLDKQGYTQVQICNSLEEFEAFYVPCTMSYYIVDYCTNTLRNAEGKVAKGNTVCGTASGDYTPALGVGIRMQQRPTSAQWNSGDSWKQWYTAEQLEILGGEKPSMRPATVPKYGTSDVAGYDGSFGSTVPWTDELGRYEVTPAQGHYYAPIEDYQNSRYYEAATEEHSALVPLVCVICGQQVISYYGEGEQYHWATDAQIEAWNDAGNEPKAEPIHGIDDKNSVKADAVDDLWIDDNPLSSGLFGTGTTTLTDDVTVNKGLLTTTKPQHEATYPDDYTDTKWLAVAGNTVIDLNGKKLTLDGIKGFEALNTSPDLKLTFRNGTLDLNDLKTFAFIMPMIEGAYYGAPVEFDNVTVECGTSNSTIMPINGGTLIFRNSVIKGGSYPPVSTNGSLTDKYNGSMNCNIILENSTVIGETIGLLFNNASANLTAKGCTFYGGQIGAVVRGGTATFEDCTFYCGTTAASGSGTWSTGTQIHAHAALVLGNNGGDYGDTTATLKGCTFGSATLGEDDVTLTATETTDSAEKLAVYALDNHETNVTLDKATANACVDSLKQHGNEDHIHLLIDLQKDTVSSAEAAALILGAATSGGAVNLPAVEGGITLGSKDEPAVLDVTKDLELVLAGTLNVTGGIKVEDGATLRIEGGAVNAGVNGTSQAIVVKNGGALNLDTVTLTVTEAQVSGDVPMSTYGVYAMENSTVTIADSKIYNAHGPALGTNNNHAPVELVLIDSAFISDVEEGKVDASTSVGLLINNDEHSVFAGGCLFYGTNAAVWVRSGKAVFAGCTFATEGVERSYNTKWGTGAGFHKDATAAVIVGNGANTAYGNAEVEIDDCTVTFKDIAGLEDVTAIVPTALSIKREEYEADWTVNGTEATTSKAITFAAVSTSTTTVNFSDIDTAKAFLDENLDLTVGGETPNVFLYEGAMASQVKVGYYTYKSEEEGGERIEPPVPIYVNQILSEAEVEEKAPEALKDAAANGGKVVLPEAAKKPVEVGGEVFQVGKDKALEVDLNGSELKLTGDGQYSTILAQAGGEVTINGNGGTLEVEDESKAPIGANGEGAKLTIKDTVLKTNVSLQGESGATVVLEGTTIISSSPMAISTNNTLQPVHYTITNCKIASYAIGNVALLINGDQVTLEATGTEFYGTCTGVWVRAAEKATFTNCTFITGSAVTSNETWGQGTLNPAAAKAALLIGDGAGNYGDVKDVTIGEGCTAVVSYEWYANRSSTSHNDEAITSVETDKITDKDGWFEFAPYDGTAKNKLFVIAEAGTQTANVKFANETVAKAFGITGQESLVKDTNVYLVKDAAAMQIVVTIGEAEPFSPKAE